MSHLTYRQLQSQLKKARQLGFTNIKLNATKEALEKEYNTLIENNRKFYKVAHCWGNMTDSEIETALDSLFPNTTTESYKTEETPDEKVRTDLVIATENRSALQKDMSCFDQKWLSMVNYGDRVTFVGTDFYIRNFLDNRNIIWDEDREGLSISPKDASKIGLFFPGLGCFELSNSQGTEVQEFELRNH